jgi:regulator of PEP synthase PpsR (kinase-PPPase family)
VNAELKARLGRLGNGSLVPNGDNLNIFIISDATGATAESVVTSVLVQFTGQRFNIKRFPFTRTIEQLENILGKVPSGECIIVFTLVSSEMREHLIDHGEAQDLIMVDVMGPLLSCFSGLLRRSPRMEPGALQHEEEDLRGLAEAIHFARLHDDGQGLDTVEPADLIILGVSRTGKTPTSFYLSCRKLKVANIPIIKDVPLPQKILDLPVKKVGFRMSIDRLRQLRGERTSRYGPAQVAGYDTEAYIFDEVEYCEQVYRRIPGLRTVDVTNRSIEEISEWITHHVL